MKILLIFPLISYVSSYILPPSPFLRCPVNANSTVSKESGSGVRVVTLDESNGRKVRIQFFYPNPFGRRRSIGENTESPTTTSGGSQEFTTTNFPQTTLKLDYDISCQWEFQAAKESQYLLLTFNKLSAPFSDNCETAYVAMEKQNGFESRWCGNRRQSNSRPMSLVSKSAAKITVFRSSDAPTTPPTGFSVTVEALDINEITGVQNNLRVLIG